MPPKTGGERYKLKHIEELQSDWLEAGEKYGWQAEGALTGLKQIENRITKKSEKLFLNVIKEFRENLYKIFDDKSIKDYTAGFAKSEQNARHALTKIYEAKDSQLQDLELFLAGTKIQYKGGDMGVGSQALMNFGDLLNLVRKISKPSITGIFTHASKKQNEIISTQEWLSKKSWNKIDKVNREQATIAKNIKDLKKQIPSMPIKEKWMQTGMNRAIKEAVDEGLDGISWANSNDQVARWGIGPTEVEKIKHGQSVIVKIPEGADRRMFISLYDNKMPGYAKRLSEQYNAEFGEIGIEFEQGDAGVRYFLKISPELKKAIETGRLKFYRRGGLVTKNTYRRGGLVSHNGYRKNMSRLGFQEGRYAR